MGFTLKNIYSVGEIGIQSESFEVKFNKFICRYCFNFLLEMFNHLSQYMSIVIL